MGYYQYREEITVESDRIRKLLECIPEEDRRYELGKWIEQARQDLWSARKHFDALCDIAAGMDLTRENR